MNNLWIQVDLLPSNFQWYPEETEILVRPYTVRETLHLAKLQRTQDIVRVHLEGIRVEGGLDPKDLVLSDLYYLALLRNGLSGTLEGYWLKGFVCEACGKATDRKIPLEEIETEDLPQRAEFTVQIGKVRAVFGPLRVKHALDNTAFPELSELPFLKEIVLALESLEIDGEPLEWKSLKEKVGLVLELPHQILQEVYDRILPYMFPRFKAQTACPECGHVDEVTIPSFEVEVKPSFRSE